MAGAAQRMAAMLAIPQVARGHGWSSSARSRPSAAISNSNETDMNAYPIAMMAMNSR
jgi:hypothetical protein